MILYFSATGNSAYAARLLSEETGEQVFPVKDYRPVSHNSLPELKPEEKIIFVFPVHSWGPAVSIMEFLKIWEAAGYAGQPVWAVCSCGDDCGLAAEVFGKALAKKGISLTGYFSVQMPNNYILLPGFDVDSKDLEEKKLDAVPARIAQIAKVIKGEESNSDDLYTKGSMPGLKTKMVYPLFCKFMADRKKFYATENCIGCGVCADVCPSSVIEIGKDKRPVWKGTCTQCLACIHNCPVRAIEYGNETKKKGRYKNKRK